MITSGYKLPQHIISRKLFRGEHPGNINKIIKNYNHKHSCKNNNNNFKKFIF